MTSYSAVVEIPLEYAILALVFIALTCEHEFIGGDLESGFGPST